MRLPPLLPLLFVCLAANARAQDLPTNAPSRDALAGLADGMSLESLPGGLLLAMAPRPGSPVRDPRGAYTFERRIVLYATDGESLTKRVTVHFEGPDRDDALRTARLTAAILHLHNVQFKRSARFPRDADTADLWMVREPAPDATVGGETRAQSVYLYGTATPRSDAEWVRTIAHEMGHLLLPAARGYSQPEGDAGGELGERLFQRWLVASPPERIWSLDGVRAAVSAKATPLVARFRQRGPHDPAVVRPDAAGMELYIGAALAFEDAFGPALLGKALYGIDSTAPQELLDAMRRAVFSQSAVTVRLPAWVPFGDDSFAFTAVTGNGKLGIDSRPPFLPDPKRPIAIQKLGWKLVKAVGGDLSAIQITRKRP